MAVAACTLNPQPLPPAADESSGFDDAGRVAPPPADGGSQSAPTTSFADDAGLRDAADASPTTPVPPDGSAGEPGDAGDAGDADAGHE
jgi:hypothetical protein